MDSQRGSVRRRGETWTAYWRGPDGRQRTKGGFRTRKEASAHLTTALAAVADGSYVERSRLTLGTFLTDHWLPAIRATVRPGTLRNYSEHVRVYVVPRIGDVPLQAVSAATLNALYAELGDSGRQSRSGGLSPTTVRRVHATLHRALRDASRWKLLAWNPADTADPPRAPEAGSAELVTWTAGEVEQFLSQVAGDRLEAAWVLAATTGMRRGEVLGLRWGDLDLDRRRAAVRQTLTASGGRLSFSTPKTRRGRRSVPLAGVTVAALRAHRRRQVEERLAWGEAYHDGDLVFTREDGSPVHPDSFSRAFGRHLSRAGLPTVRLHDLRHTWATLALVRGVQVKTVSEVLGHSTSSFTADVYQHSVPAVEEAAADAVADAIFGGRVDNSLTREG